MTPQHFTILYDDVFAGFVYTHTIHSNAGFKTKAVIIYIENTVKDLNAAAGINIQAIAIESVTGILKCRIFYYDVFTVKNVRVPERGVAGRKTIEQDI
jgi:hypothetical protein